MNFIDRLQNLSTKKNSLLCIGLDPDLARIPESLKNESDPLYTFCLAIIESTKHVALAFKPNFAFFEAEGAKGWRALEKLMDNMPPNVLTIADAKRADIGNSSQKYAEAILQRLNFDAVTVSPYMGQDSVAPFLQWPEKGAFVLGLTSNPGAKHFQHLQIHERPLYKKVAKEVVKWNTNGNCGLVVGATHEQDLGAVRSIAPGLPFLIPGVGAQGGSLSAAVKHGTDCNGGLAVINASRSIIYKSGNSDFAETAKTEAEALHQEINRIRALKINSK